MTWHWQPGMRSKNGYRFISVVGLDILVCSMEGSGEITKFVEGRRITWGPEGVHTAAPGARLPEWPDEPDLDDAATRGALLDQVRKRWALPRAHCVFVSDTQRWEVVWSGATHGGALGVGPSEGEALLDALT